MKPSNSVPGSRLEKSFVFVLNNINVDGQLPIEVAPGHFFEKADSEQAVWINRLLKLYIPWGPSGILGLPYEIDFSKTSGSSAFQIEPLPKDKWRYWVISFKGSNAELGHIESAASLLRNDLELGFTVFGKSSIASGEAFGMHAASLFSFFESQAMGQPILLVTGDELREIRQNYDLIKKIDPEHEYITGSLRKCIDLKSLPRNSELLIIGLFSIIESLITHCPSHPNIDDSVNHQIQTKIPLLSKRFSRELEYVKHFGKIEEHDVWKKLYKYRNSIIHGEHPSLAGRLQKELGSRENVYEFLKETVKLLLLLAFKEPILLTDLKKC